MRRIFFFICFAGSLFCIPAALKHFTQGFRLAKMQFEAPSFFPEARPTEEVLSIFNQSFHYLDRGAQCYVFSSFDEKYVIKLFRASPPSPNPFHSFWKKKKKRTSFHTKIYRLFSACHIAATELPNETAIVYTHLNLTKETLPILRVRDPIGRKYLLPLDEYRFVLQKKADPFRETLEKAIQNPHKMEQCLNSFYELLLSRVQKGIGNSDPTLSRNFGFLGERAVEIDFGSYFPDPRLSSSEGRKIEIHRYINRLEKWLEKNAPEWADYFDQKRGQS
ncbi:MAG: hypothetical protein A3E80_00330 [Chlamydiae bacterium RIFCSPHIGHO2_12_FULL_49_9]|nr:MAG: hypothetical protein A3E80_00330 [Chlamydiae bacterium RIFCSPHIGHO2_12_FULL_49_9]